MKNRSMLWFFVVVVFILPATTYALVKWYGDHASPLPVYTTAERSTFQLANQFGESRDESSWANHIIVANFFFSTCPTICPTMMKNLKKVRQSFPKDDVRITSFTVDPERDSVGRLLAFGKRYGCNEGGWDLLTGSKQGIYKLARKGFGLLATDGDGGEGDFIHSEKLILIDAKTRIRGYYDGTEERDVQKLIRDIKRLKNEK